jgi:hypothetical protein
MTQDDPTELSKLTADKVIVHLLTELRGSAEMMCDVAPSSEVTCQPSAFGPDGIALEFVVRLVTPRDRSSLKLAREKRADDRLGDAVRGLQALLEIIRTMPEGASMEDALVRMRTDTEGKFRFRMQSAKDYQDRVRAAFNKGKLTEDESAPLLAIRLRTPLGN